MLSEPRSGWTSITVFGSNIGCASYLDDVPNMLLDVFIQYFEAVRDNRYTSFSVTFDAEGSHFGMFVFDDTLYYVNDENNTPPYLNTEEINDNGKYVRAHEALITLAKELADDVVKNIELWRHWNPDEDEDTKEELLEKVEKLKSLL